VIRPQEVVAALQTVAQAYTDYYSAVADYDRAQFRLYHALGHPAQNVAESAFGPATAATCEPEPPRVLLDTPVACPAQ
jgi:hypothetical protein